MQVTISVIVPFRNARSHLPVLAEALRAQHLPSAAFEVLWIDDGSRDGGAAWLREHAHANWRIFDSAPPFSSYAARNRGILAARADALAFTDADCRPDASWLTCGLSALERAPRVAGRIQIELSTPPLAAEIVDATRFLRQEHYVTEGFAAAANLFVRKNVFDKVGLFDEALVSGGDNEFGWRCLSAGIPIAYAPDALVAHPARRTVRALLRKGRRIGFGAGQIARRRRMPFSQMAKRAIERVALAKGTPVSGAPRSPRVALLHVALAAANAVGLIGGFLRRP